MVQYLVINKISIYTKCVKNPRKHKKCQVMVHKQGQYPYVASSYDTKKEADKNARKLIKETKQNV